MTPEPKPDLPVSPPLVIDIAMPCAAWAAAGIDAAAIAERALGAAFADGVRHRAITLSGPAEASLMLTDDATITGFNRDWRGQDKPTNVLSFAAMDDADDAVEMPPGAERLLGDIVIAFETTDAEARRDGKTLADHLSHLCVHGMLHLLGFDHETDADAEEMEALETEILATLGIDNPYHGDASAGHDASENPEL